MKFTTISTYLSGGVCGNLWMPCTLAGIPLNIPIKSEFTLGEETTFEEALTNILMKYGGDFRRARFAADTVIRVERRMITAPGKYSMHIWEREVLKLPNCADLVDAETYVADFLGEE